MITETKTRLVEPDITVYEIAGRLNLGNSLQSVENSIRRLVDDGVRKLVIDLAGLNFIDSSGMGMLVMCSGYIEQKGGRLRIAGARGGVAKGLEISHIDRIAPLDADVEAACRHLAAGGAVA
jgi:anti-sigma B factor antagonist